MGVYTFLTQIVQAIGDATIPGAKLANGAIKTKLTAEADGNKLTTAEMAAAAAITNAQLAGSIAATKLAGSIPDSKLTQIVTASKVSGAALTELASVPAGAGILPVANLGTTPGAGKFLDGTGAFSTPATDFDTEKGLRGFVADQILLHGRTALGGQLTTWIGFASASRSKIYGTADCSGGKDLGGGADTIIANADAFGNETVTFGAGAAGTATSGAALNTGRFLIVLGDNDTLPLVEDTAGPVDVVVLAGFYATGNALAAAIATALTNNATLNGIYGCDYVEATNKFTITADMTFAIPWTTADGDEISATLGFTADDAAAATYTADVAVVSNTITGANDTFTIAKNGGAGTLCTVAAGNHVSLAAVDTAIETALTGAGFTGVGITVAGNKIIFTSTQLGSGSAVLLTAGATDFLRMIDCQAGSVAYVAGTGWAANVAAASLAEIIAEINLQQVAGHWDAEADGNYVRLASKTTGATSTLVMGNGAANADLGFTNTEGAIGRASAGLEAMGDANYHVFLTSLHTRGGTSPGAMQVSQQGLLNSGFGIRVTTAASIENVDWIVVGAGA